MPLPDAIFPAAIFDGGRIIDNPADTITDSSSDESTKQIGGAAIMQLKAEIKAIETQLKTQFQIDLNVKQTQKIALDDDKDTYIRSNGDDDVEIYVGGTRTFRTQGNGNVFVGGAAIATDAVTGFFHVPSCAGTPTGVPSTTVGATKPLVYDSTNDILYIYNNSAWTPVGAGTIGGSGTASFIARWTAADTIAVSAYGDDATYGTLMKIGSATFTAGNTLARWRGTTIPDAFIAASGNGVDILFRAQSGFNSGNTNGASWVFMPGGKNASGSDGTFQIRQPGGSKNVRLWADANGGHIDADSDPLFCKTVKPEAANTYYMGDHAADFKVVGVRNLARVAGYPLSFLGSGLDYAASDANAFLQILEESIPPFYAVEDADGLHAYFRVQGGGPANMANPNGGNYVFYLSEKGGGGSGADGKFFIMDPSNINSINFSFDGSGNGVITTDADLYLAAGGVVAFGTHSGLGGESLTGYITIKDIGGASRKLGVVS